MTLLKATNVRKQFGGLTAVNDLSFQLAKNEILGLIGPNGAGKTTVFNCLTGLLPMDAGQVHLENNTITGLRPHQICRLGMARTFQIVRPFLNISVLDNAIVGALMWEKKPAIARQLAQEIIDFVGLGPYSNELAESLPLPLRKRLELAKAMATKPKALLLDEVMAGLTPTEVDELIRLIDEVRHQGVGVLLIEHVMRGVMALSDRVIVINNGTEIAQGNPEDIVNEVCVIEAYLGKEYAGAVC